MNAHENPSATIWVLASDTDGDLSRYAGPLEIGIERLKEHMAKFSQAIAEVVADAHTLAGEFELKEVKLKATLSAEHGFVLVSKAGVEGGIELTFHRQDKNQATSK